MKIDNALNVFIESYDREAMESLDRISKDYSVNISKSTINAFNLNECVERFKNYLNGYAEYMIKNRENPDRSSRESIAESVNRFIHNGLVEDVAIGYKDIPGFVQRYASGIKEILETVDQVKSNMMENDVELEAVGDVNDFTDMFMDRINESFTPTMDRFLWASGYYSKKRMFDKTRKGAKPPIFI